MVKSTQFHQYFTWSFYRRRSQTLKKKTVKLSVFFALLGSESIKCACKMLVKLTPSYWQIKMLIKIDFKCNMIGVSVMVDRLFGASLCMFFIQFKVQQIGGIIFLSIFTVQQKELLASYFQTSNNRLSSQ